MISRLIFGLGLFVGSLVAGWWLGRMRRVTEARAHQLIRITVTVGSPITMCLSFWGLPLVGTQPLLLPSIGLLVSVSTLAPAWWYARAARLSRPQTGSVLTSAMFSNLGFLGAFVAFALHGEEAYSLACVHLLYFSPAFYLIGFEVAKRFGHKTPQQARSRRLPEESRFYPFLGILVGVALNLLGVPRPSLLKELNDILIPLNTATYLIGIGSQLRLEPLRPWLAPCLALSAIKFWYSPLVGWALVCLFGLSGLPKFIVLLQSAMPVGISPLMLPTLFGVDRRLSNALWLFTTLASLLWLVAYIPFIR